MSDTIDKQFVEYIAKTLVEDADAVKVDRTIDERGVLLQLHVAPEDLGRVIGRAGSTAKSIRTLLRALSIKNDARYNLKIVDSGDPAHSVSVDDNAAADSGSDVDVTESEDEAADETIEQPDHSEESDAEDDVVSRHRQDIADLTDDLEE
jgi:uncharacterized protein